MVNTGIKTYHTSKIAGLSTRFQNKSDVLQGLYQSQIQNWKIRKFRAGRLENFTLTVTSPLFVVRLHSRDFSDLCCALAVVSL